MLTNGCPDVADPDGTGRHEPALETSRFYFHINGLWYKVASHNRKSLTIDAGSTPAASMYTKAV